MRNRKASDSPFRTTLVRRHGGIGTLMVDLNTRTGDSHQTVSATPTSLDWQTVYGDCNRWMKAAIGLLAFAGAGMLAAGVRRVVFGN